MMKNLVLTETNNFTTLIISENVKLVATTSLVLTLLQ